MVLLANVCAAQYQLILDANGDEAFRYSDNSKLIRTEGGFYDFSNSEIKKNLSMYLTYQNSIFFDPLMYDAIKFRIDDNRIIIPASGQENYVKLDRYDKVPGYEMARVYQKSIYNEFGEMIYSFDEVPPKWIIATIYFDYWERTYENNEDEIKKRRKNSLRNTRVMRYLNHWESLIAPGKFYEDYNDLEEWGRSKRWIAIVQDRPKRFYPLRWEDVIQLDDRWLNPNKEALESIVEEKLRKWGYEGDHLYEWEYEGKVGKAAFVARIVKKKESDFKEALKIE